MLGIKLYAIKYKKSVGGYLIQPSLFGFVLIIIKLCLVNILPIYPYYALHMARVDDIDVRGRFLTSTYAGTYQSNFC